MDEGRLGAGALREEGLHADVHVLGLDALAEEAALQVEAGGELALGAVEDGALEDAVDLRGEVAALDLGELLRDRDGLGRDALDLDARRAEKLQRRASRVGFDWPNSDGVYDKLDEEIAELKAADTDANREEELGDLLFTVVNLARKLGVDPEEALRKGNDKFNRRFRAMEASGPLDGLDLDALEARWTAAKEKR